MEKSKKRETETKQLTPVTLKQVRGGAPDAPTTSDIKTRAGHILVFPT